MYYVAISDKKFGNKNDAIDFIKNNKLDNFFSVMKIMEKSDTDRTAKNEDQNWWFVEQNSKFWGK